MSLSVYRECIKVERNLLKGYKTDLKYTKESLSDLYYKMNEKDEDTLEDLHSIKRLIGEVLRLEFEIEESYAEIDLLKERMQ